MYIVSDKNREWRFDSREELLDAMRDARRFPFGCDNAPYEWLGHGVDYLDANPIEVWDALNLDDGRYELQEAQHENFC